MRRSRLTSCLGACLVVTVAQAGAPAALMPRGFRQLARPVEANLSQGETGGAVADGRLAPSHFFSPTASTPVKPHVLTLHDREILRQQIQGTAQGSHVLSPSSMHK
ncbi:transglutaminase [Thiomonas sp.]